MRTPRNSLIGVGSLFLIFLLIQFVAAATTEEVIEKINKSHAEMGAIEFDYMITLMITLKSVPFQNEVTGHQAEKFVEKDAKSVVHHMYQKWEERNFRLLIVDDGEFLWRERSSPANPVVSVSKRRATIKHWCGLSDRVHKVTKDFDLKLTGEDTLDGEKVWVLEGPAKAVPADDDMGKVRMLVSQKDCMARLVITYDKDGKERMNELFRNVKVNQPIDPALFKYTPPAGAEVQDRT